MRKKLVAMLCSVTIAAMAVTGCGTGAKNSTAKKDANGAVEVDFWFSGGKTAVNVLQSTVDDFNKSQKKYHINTVTQADYDETYEKLQAGIAGKKDFCTIFITKAMMNSEIGFGRKVLQAFEENNISFEHMPSGIDTMTIVVHADEFIDKEQSVVSAIHRLAEPDSVEIESGLALIAVVGRGMKSASGTAGKLFTALANKGINIKMIDQGSSELNIIIGVRNKDFEPAIRAIYDTFIVDKKKN